ncbi:unnamed protein product, partial [Didymodactylos carnosus]
MFSNQNRSSPLNESDASSEASDETSRATPRSNQDSWYDVRTVNDSGSAGQQIPSSNNKNNSDTYDKRYLQQQEKGSDRSNIPHILDEDQYSIPSTATTTSVFASNAPDRVSTSTTNSSAVTVVARGGNNTGAPRSGSNRSGANQQQQRATPQTQVTNVE